MICWPSIRTAKSKFATGTRQNGTAALAAGILAPEALANLPIDADSLKPHPILSLLPAETLNRLLAKPAFSESPKGTVVFKEGDPCDAIYLIISGRCESLVRGGNGVSVVEEVFGPGDMLGERALIHGEPHRSTVTVVTHSLLLRIPSEELQELFTRDPSVAGRFAQTITERVRQIRERRTSHHATVRRIVSLFPLSPRIDALAVVRKLAKSLQALTGQSLLLIHAGSSHAAASLDDWSKQQRRSVGEFAFKSQLREHESGFFELRLSATATSATSIAPMLSHCGRHFDFVVVHVQPDIPVSVSIETMIQSDLSYVLLQPSVQNLYDFQLLIRELCERTRGHCQHVKPILFAEEHVAAADMHATLKQLGHPLHSFARGFPLSNDHGAGDRRFDLHINRLAREIARRRIGLALSSGGAKGLAHIGVIQVLEENGIEIDCIAGASMGAYIGSLWAYGLDGVQLEKIAREHEGRWGLWSLVDPALPPRQGFLRTTRVAHRLRRSIGDAHFSDLIRPLRIVATHLDTLERILFSSGEVAETVAASIAIPGVCVPVTIDGETYIDGGIADPLPVDVLEEMGVEKIIAVNVIPPPEKLRQWLDLEREQHGHVSRFVKMRRAFSDRFNYFAHGNILDTMLQAVNGAQTRVAEAAALHADVLLRPLACDAYWHDFRNPGKYIALGRKAAEDQLAELKALAQPHEKRPSPPLAIASDFRAA